MHGPAMHLWTYVVNTSQRITVTLKFNHVVTSNLEIRSNMKTISLDMIQIHVFDNILSTSCILVWFFHCSLWTFCLLCFILFVFFVLFCWVFLVAWLVGIFFLFSYLFHIARNFKQSQLLSFLLWNLR